MKALDSGEQIVFFKDKILRTKAFYVFGKAKIVKSTPLRINQFLPVPKPSFADISAHCEASPEAMESESLLASIFNQGEVVDYACGKNEAERRVLACVAQLSPKASAVQRGIALFLAAESALIEGFDLASQEEELTGHGAATKARLDSTYGAAAGLLPPSWSSVLSNPIFEVKEVDQEAPAQQEKPQQSGWLAEAAATFSGLTFEAEPAGEQPESRIESGNEPFKQPEDSSDKTNDEESGMKTMLGDDAKVVLEDLTAQARLLEEDTQKSIEIVNKSFEYEEYPGRPEEVTESATVDAIDELERVVGKPE